MWVYDRHKHEEKELSLSADLPSCYVRPNSIDAWRHRRMMEGALLVARQFAGSTWLTVGDGRFGSNAFFLQNHGFDVIATSISSHTLEVAHKKGFIKKYRAENAECFTLQDSSVDFVLCKEAFHHFPRPAIGFYEMLRISRKGVVLIEPMEAPSRPLTFLKNVTKRIMRGNVTDQFEPSGNFVYRIRIQEIIKMLTALGHQTVAWQGINDFWHQSFEDADCDKLSIASCGTRLGIRAQNVLAKLKLLNFGLATVVCFKEKPDRDALSKLREGGFTVLTLPRNPYN
jgi:ubiquinone/menaquinone biosynthesis C-methylase UbiE